MTERSLRAGFVAWLFTVYFVYPIPHMVAVSNVLLVFGLALSVWIIRRNPSWRNAMPSLRQFRVAGWILVALTCWLLIQSSLISPYPQLALNFWRHDWLNGLLVFVTGGCAALSTRNRSRHRLLMAIVLALFAHVVILLGYQAWQWANAGLDPFNNTPFAQKDYHSMLVTTLIGLLLADLVGKARPGGKIAPILSLPLSAVLFMLTLSLLATATLLARNAVIITMILLLVSIAVFGVTGAKQLGRRTLPAVAALLLTTGIVTSLGLSSDSRWQGFSEAASVAFNTRENLAWLDGERYPRPLMSSGLPVEESAYLRLAWAKVALEQIQRYPLGLGYSHKAFGWAVNRSYGVQTRLESSHSGLLDFTLANGIPGLLLWLGLSGALMMAGWQGFRKSGSPAGLMLAFSVFAYLVRCVLDGHLSGFRLEMYALLVGVLVMMQALETERCE